MAAFIRANIIKEATLRLINSRAQSGLVDFLVLKRALKRSGSDEVPFSSVDHDFTGAMDDLAATFPPTTGITPPSGTGTFVKVFGILDYVTKRWITNGPADTLSGPKWANAITVIGKKPRRGKLRSDYIKHIKPLTLKSKGDILNIFDAAVWYFRSTDISSIIGNTVNTADVLLRIKNAFIGDLGMTTAEVDSLFSADPAPYSSVPPDGFTSTSCGNPLEYLPGINKGAAERQPIESLAESFLTECEQPNISISINRALLSRFLAALISKRLLILTGLSGSGKTKLAQAFSYWITPAPEPGLEHNPHFALVPVGADWTSNDQVLGYADGIRGNTYVMRPTLRLILSASENPAIPHFLILDEMNLSHVERYFADILSSIESGAPIPLHEGADMKAGEIVVPSSVSIPPNLFIIGTVNVDETTYMFSPKVLDRANVIEFRMLESEIDSFLESPGPVGLDDLAAKGEAFGAALVTAAESKPAGVPDAVKEHFKAEMMLFFRILQQHQAEFGYRTAHEAMRFVYFYKELGQFADDDSGWFDGAMDAVVVQRLLPKLHGSRSQLEGLLWALACACGAQRKVPADEEFTKRCLAAGKMEDEKQNAPEAIQKALGENEEGGVEAHYPLSFDKVLRMHRKLVRDQFVTFAEA